MKKKKTQTSKIDEFRKAYEEALLIKDKQIEELKAENLILLKTIIKQANELIENKEIKKRFEQKKDKT